jgi:CubicO group peptidase (beta-lactamase class C family)
MRTHRFLQTLALTFALVVGGVHAATPPVARQATATPDRIALTGPERVGFSSESLKELDAAMQGIVDKKQLAGVVTLVARHGQVVQHKAYGVQDIEGQKPMALDAIMRIYSMTKPIAGAAMMMLYEEGKWKPGDPIAKYIPEFANLKVFAGTDAAGTMLLEAPKHPPTMGELMSHNAGFTYGLFGNTPVDKLYQAANPLEAPSLQAFIDKVAPLPLLYQPGEKWVYSVSVDIQGYLVQKLSGKSFPDFLRDRIFTPLGMKDTGFAPTPERMARVATVYQRTPDGSLRPAANANQLISGTYFSASGGLMSTAEDYLQFAQMLVNGGALNGKRYLSPKTVELMTSNATGDMVNGQFGRPAKGMGFALGVQVWLDPVAADRRVSAGAFGWEGAYGTHQVMDPAEKIVEIIMMQGANGPLQRDFENSVRQAIID